MPPALICPKCRGTLSLFVGRAFRCPYCSSVLIATGWAEVRVFEVVSLAFGVFILPTAWFWLGWPVAAIAFASLIAAEVYVRRTFLKIEQSSALADDQRAT
jgi:hypothetical protein